MEADIRDRARTFALFEEEKFEAVAHLAAMAGVRNAVKYPDLYVEVDLNGTQHLMDAFSSSRQDIRRPSKAGKAQYPRGYTHKSSGCTTDGCAQRGASRCRRACVRGDRARARIGVTVTRGVADLQGGQG